MFLIPVQGLNQFIFSCFQLEEIDRKYILAQVCFVNGIIAEGNLTCNFFQFPFNNSQILKVPTNQFMSLKLFFDLSVFLKLYMTNFSRVHYKIHLVIFGE